MLGFLWFMVGVVILITLTPWWVYVPIILLVLACGNDE